MYKCIYSLNPFVTTMCALPVGECRAADYQFGVTGQVPVSEDIQDKIQVG